MIEIPGGSARLCDGMLRRDFLRLGTLGSVGLSLPQLLRADAGAKKSGHGSVGGKAKSCIVFFLMGGMSHIDTVDMKPAAPDGIRSPFGQIPTRTPGLKFCEYLPLLADLTPKYALIRSMSHKATNHNPACYQALTGGIPSRDIVTLPVGPDDAPNPGSVISRLAPTKKPVPNFVQLSDSLVGDSRLQMPGQTSGYLSAAYDPLKVTANPNEPTFNVEELALPDGVSPQRFARRRSLLQTVESEFPLIADLPEIGKMDTFYQRAYQLVTSPETKRAFDIRQEPLKLRERYGRNQWGQSCLLARRLVESGVRLVTIYWGGALNAPDDYWDTHRGNFTKQKDKLLPIFDRCFSALLTDLSDRGLLDETLVVCLGEFGRTPKIGQVTANASTNATGRDHWPYCYSLFLAGGGVHGGAIIGKSDAQAAYPVDRPLTPEDYTATIYHAMGLDPETEVRDRLNRPLPISRGEPIHELFS